VASQGQAATAVRLEALLVTRTDTRNFPERLDRISASNSVVLRSLMCFQAELKRSSLL